MVKPTALEKLEAVDVADSEVMPHVEIRASPIGGKVVGIDERGVAAVGGIVDGMAISVGHTQRQVTHGALHSHLQGMIDLIRFISKRIDVVESRECGTNRSSADDIPASNRKIAGHLTGNGCAIYRATSEVRGRTNGVSRQTRAVWV